MSCSGPMHPSDMDKLYASALEHLRWARIVELTENGADERGADLFAQLEIEKRKQLAQEIGPQRALLSNLFREVGENCWTCAVRYVPPPEGLWKMRFGGFDD